MLRRRAETLAWDAARRRALRLVSALALAAASAGCGAARPLRPLPRGAMAAEVSLPAVWVRSESAAFPVGSPVAGMRLGVTDAVEASARLYPLLLATGIVGLEGGATWHARPAHGWAPGLHGGATLSVLSAPGHLDGGLGHALRGAVALEGTAHWEPTPRLWPYAVAQGALVLASGHPVASVFVGVQARVSERWDVSLETGVAGLNERARDYAQPYVDVAGHGALWVGGAVTWRFSSPARSR